MRWGVLLLCIGLAALTSTAADWTQFRGNGTGVSSEKEIPAEWTADKNVLWKTKIPGVGWSQPIVVGDKVFVTTAVTENQRKPSSGGFGGGGGGGGFGKGGPGGGGGSNGGTSRQKSDAPRRHERDPTINPVEPGDPPHALNLCSPPASGGERCQAAGATTRTRRWPPCPLR